MKFNSTAPRFVSWLAAAFLAAGCASPGSVALRDGTLVDNPPSTDFNTSANWSPVGVPTGTATMPRNDVFPPSDIIEILRPTTLAAIRQMDGRFVLLMEPGGDTMLTGEGLIVCCKAGFAIVSSYLTGNVTIGSGAGLGYGVSGGGTIKGTVTVSGGAFGAGGRELIPSLGTLTVDGSLTAEKEGTVYTTVTPSMTTQFRVLGAIKALGGSTQLLVDVQDMDQSGPARMTVVAATATAGITGKFASVKTTSRWYKAEATYTPNSIVVTLTRQTAPRQMSPMELRQNEELRSFARVGKR